MTKERLEFYLNRNNTFGYNTQNDESYVGWIKVYKLFPMKASTAALGNARTILQRSEVIKKPYRVNIEKVSRDVFEGDKFPINEDYIIKESHGFESLDQVEQFLLERGYNLSEIKWGVDFDFL
jgi:hypothetical protein